MSLIDARARFVLPLAEQADSLLPSDAAGNLADPTIPSGVARPAVVDDTILGFGRNFVRASAHGFLYDDAADDLLLTRAATVVALLRLDTASLSTGNKCVLFQRGRGGAGDQVAVGFQLLVNHAGNRNVSLQMFWDTVAGVRVTDVGQAIIWPLGEFLLIAATREVVDGEFAVRYQINGEAGTGETHALDCGGATAADVSVGMGMASAVYGDHLDGVLDYIEVLDEAVTPEEFELLWWRLAIAQPDGVTTMRRMVPPGVYSQDPESRIQLELAAEGRALGYAKALARRLRHYGRPEKAWGEVLETWERLTGRAPLPGDSVAQRRARVLEHLGTVWTFSHADVKAQLEESLDLDSADIDILEYGNDFEEDFTAGTPSVHAVVEAGNGAWLSDAAAVAAGYQEFTASADDLKYGGIRDPNSGLYLWPLAGDGRDAWVHGKVDVVTLPDDTVFGFAIGSRSSDDWIFIGIAATAGTQRVAALKYRNRILDGALTTLGIWASDPTFFRIFHDGAGNYLVKYGTSDANAIAHAGVAIADGPTAPGWAGLCAVSRGQAGTVTGVVRFDDFFVHAPFGRSRFNWYAYRDPGLPGGPVMEKARAVVAKIKPANTSASAVQLTNVLCDDPTRLTDREPIGA